MTSKKKVLFITIHFREYIYRIAESISREVNADVDIFYSDYQVGWLHRIIGKVLGKKAVQKCNQQAQKRMLKRKFNELYDYIFVLVGRGINCTALNDFIRRQKLSKKILYLWDDVMRVDEFEEIKDGFDDIVSFDRVDCEKYGLRFLPLFFCDEFRYKNEKKDIDFSCVGELHTYRSQLLSQIQQQFPTERFHWSALLSTTCFNKIKLFLSGKKLYPFIKAKRLPMAETADISKRSKIVIDMPYPSQKGLSIRTLESIASRAKIITTNRDIVNYDFYNNNNIFLIDINNAIITSEFINCPFIPLNDDVLEKYSLSSWVHNLFLI